MSERRAAAKRRRDVDAGKGGGGSKGGNSNGGEAKRRRGGEVQRRFTRDQMMRVLARVKPGGDYQEQDQRALAAALAGPRTRRRTATSGVAEDEKDIVTGTIRRVRLYFALDDLTGAPITKNTSATFAKHGGAGAGAGAAAGAAAGLRGGVARQPCQFWITRSEVAYVLREVYRRACSMRAAGTDRKARRKFCRGTPERKRCVAQLWPGRSRVDAQLLRDSHGR